MSALYHAADAGDLALVQALLEQGVDAINNSSWNSVFGRTPLIAASQKGHLPVVRYLVEQGADIENIDPLSCTPLIHASRNGNLEVVCYLLAQGANTNKADSAGFWTPLHYAAQYGYLEIAKLLMAYGANLNFFPIDVARTEEIRQAIRDEPRRRRDQQPHKRCVEQDQQPIAAPSASEIQEDGQTNSKQPAEEEAEESKVADEDQDSEPSSDEDDRN